MSGVWRGRSAACPAAGWWLAAAVAGLGARPACCAELRHWWLAASGGISEVEVVGHDRGELVTGVLEQGGWALAVAVVLSWSPLRWLTLACKAGAHRWEHHFELNGSAAGDGISGDLREAGYGALWALGLELGVPAGLFFDFYWQRFYNIEGEAGIDAKAVGLGWRF